MDIVYIQRADGRGFLHKRFHSLQRYLRFYNQDGFFEQSLASIDGSKHTVRFVNAHQRDFRPTDFVIVNLKATNFNSSADRRRFFREIVGMDKAGLALFINAASAEFMLSEEELEFFDVIFKREPFKDRDKYNISDENKAKIVPTMIHCPFAYAPRDNIFAKTFHALRQKVKACGADDEQKYDVGFSGADAAAHSLRRDVWERVIDEGFSAIGGLQPNPNTKEPIPPNLQGPRVKGKHYRDSLCAAKVNLALPGIGEYTFRHQELLYLGAFMLSHTSVTEQELPMPLEEGKHYVAFSDLDDMVAKIRYYLTQEDERRAIAAAGKRLFDEYYDPVQHGRDIVAALQSARST